MVLTVLTFSFLYILNLSMNPYQSAKETASKVARQYTDLDEVDRFTIYNGKKSYYSLLGKNRKKTQLAVLIEADSDKIYTYELSKGISQEKAEKIAKDNGAKQIDKVTFGYIDGQPIWEVKSETTYYNVDFETGTILRKEGL
ncbi:Peptidase propeptide and YPEB domain protein [Streptococcus intermedius]|uniref:Uncharacterized protein n=3 Tax=Streptococcus intermedius TaxID=1338 RepID=T1ZER5_STRIT|nr:DUF5590 domain-containing protein [Streptococcus intermedius]AGU76206.1 hypothetical protein SIR_0841 [Streptococcus intermedius B196]EKU17172.1 peptidase propeptide and YPEB domain protein [Streptococcus intermedius BA1]RSJ11490.1 Peptidase propeptide and YPEB domain protein [Streptococcus intermedius]RSJ17609.1 Peptidase propeptide and YPEB domain protein [Streptococcus intermedius]RSJ19391.1 Peptidase propeptide and YPEB domain protein [Streptococcus intermedius]